MERAQAGEAISNKTVQESLATRAASPPPAAIEEAPSPPAADATPPPVPDEAAPPVTAPSPPEDNDDDKISESTWLGRRLIVANKAAGDAWLEDWTQFELDAVVMDAVRATAEAWRKLVEHLEQRRT